jgi:hypothetical protein
MNRQPTTDRLEALNRLAQLQASWSARERRHQRELVRFLQRRQAWELSLAQGGRAKQTV